MSFLNELANSAAQSWQLRHPAKFIAPNGVPRSFGDKIKTLVPYDTRDGAPVSNTASQIPWVIIPDMPQDQYPRYCAMLLAATTAATQIVHPALSSSLATHDMRKYMVPIVGVRVGMCYAMALPAASVVSSYSDMLYWDPKRKNVWVRSWPDDFQQAAWAEKLSAHRTVSPECMEVLLMWARVAPLVVCMASTQEFALGSGFSVPFVENAITDFMRQNLTDRAFSLACTGLPHVWDAAREAAIGGLPRAAVHAWAHDPMLAVTAERRVLMDSGAIATSRRRAADIARKHGAALSSRVSSSNWLETHDDYRVILEAQEYVMHHENDAVSLASALMEETIEGALGPGDSVSEAPTARVSRAPSPRPFISAEAASAIRAAVTHAQEHAAPPASVFRNINADRDTDIMAHW